jgi:hypothetical protein
LPWLLLSQDDSYIAFFSGTNFMPTECITEAPWAKLFGIGLPLASQNCARTGNTANNALNPFTGLTGAQVAKANVYNAAGITSPLVTASATPAPRFLILGGQALTGTTGTGGALSSTVYYNSKP